MNVNRDDGDNVNGEDEGAVDVDVDAEVDVDNSRIDLQFRCRNKHLDCVIFLKYLIFCCVFAIFG
jgi:hypothetical protein